MALSFKPLWIAVHLPSLPLEAFASTLGPEQEALPLALLKGARLAAVNEQAARRGLRPGQQRSTALALAPDVVLGHADELREAALLQAAGHAALGFTPSVSLQGQRTVLLEVSTTLRAFGGLERLLAALGAALEPLRLSCRLATAPTAGGAALLAHGRRDLPVLAAHTRDVEALRRLLDEAPLLLLPAAQAHAQALQGMGLQTLADLRALPREGVARRFGPALLAELDAARGEAPQAHAWISLPQRFEARLELFARADTTEQVLHGAGILLERLIAWARARRCRVLRFALAMLHEPRHRNDESTPPRSTLPVALAEPSNDRVHIGTLLREQLARLALPAPTLELRLYCRDVVASDAPSGELFPTQDSEREGLVRLIERLQARLGPQRVLRVQRVADHRPERATVLAPLDPAQLLARTGTPAREPAPPWRPIDQPFDRPIDRQITRPAWLLPEPQALADRQSLPLLDGRPLQVLAGPERIEAGWWDGEPTARDYFVAQSHDGSLVWIYRSRLPQAEPGPEWFLHGRFA
ncbi:MAG: DNA polymerase Y family protein [Rubrivivax sp.]|nr:DNA polymerase Y family protein [Rubrivivax sp.]